jgi:hypothetical protein
MKCRYCREKHDEATFRNRKGACPSCGMRDMAMAMDCRMEMEKQGEWVTLPCVKAESPPVSTRIIDGRTYAQIETPPTYDGKIRIEDHMYWAEKALPKKIEPEPKYLDRPTVRELFEAYKERCHYLTYREDMRSAVIIPLLEWLKRYLIEEIGPFDIEYHMDKIIDEYKREES